MRKLLVIFLISTSFSCFGQDSLQINFGENRLEISSQIEHEISNFFESKKAERIKVTAYFSETGSPSQNRLLAEKQLQTVRAEIFNDDVPFNIVSSSIVLVEEGQTKGCDVKIVAFFADAKGEHVLKKSSLVQISEIIYSKPINLTGSVQTDISNAEPDPIVEDSENEIVLDEAAFKKDATVSLPNLIFQGSTHYFISSSERVLRALLKVMQSRKDIEIELQGHVCCNPPGTDAYDIATGQQNLSIMRAKAVYNYLIEGGIAAERMTYKGFGSSNRLYPEEKNETEKTLNRRVEVLVTKSD